MKDFFIVNPINVLVRHYDRLLLLIGQRDDVTRLDHSRQEQVVAKERKPGISGWGFLCSGIENIPACKGDF